MRDRILHRIALPLLPDIECAVYLDHRLRVAGWKGGVIFPRSVAVAICRAAGGRHRRVNLIADRALMAAYAAGAHEVTLKHVRQAVAELSEQALRPGWRWWR